MTCVPTYGSNEGGDDERYDDTLQHTQEELAKEPDIHCIPAINNRIEILQLIHYILQIIGIPFKKMFA